MLNEFFEEWVAAVNSRVTVPESIQRDENGEVLSETSKFTFRGKEIEMISKPGKDEDHVELYFPATNKFIASTKFPTRTKGAISILMYISDKADEFEKHRKVRQELLLQRIVCKMVNQWKTTLAELHYSETFQKIILETAEKNTRRGHTLWDNNLMWALKQYDAEFNGLAAFIESEKIKRQFLDTMYRDIAHLLNGTITNAKGMEAIAYKLVEKYLLPQVDHWSGLRKNSRTILREIFEKCQSRAQFHYILTMLAKHFEIITGTKLEFKLAEDRAKSNNFLRNRIMSDNNRRGQISIFDNCSFGTLGDRVGADLDGIDTTENDKPKDIKKPNPNKRRKKMLKDNPDNSSKESTSTEMAPDASINDDSGTDPVEA